MVIEILNISNLSNQDIIKILKVDVSFFPTLLLVFSQVNTNWGKLHQKRGKVENFMGYYFFIHYINDLITIL